MAYHFGVTWSPRPWVAGFAESQSAIMVKVALGEFKARNHSLFITLSVIQAPLVRVVAKQTPLFSALL